MTIFLIIIGAIILGSIISNKVFSKSEYFGGGGKANKPTYCGKCNNSKQITYYTCNGNKIRDLRDVGMGIIECSTCASTGIVECFHCQKLH